MEIEAKYCIADPQVFTTIAALTHLGDYTLEAAPELEHQRNIYYDTTDGRLRKANNGLRIREVGNRSIATLKGANQGQAELHQRDEWEIETSNPDPRSWPPGPGRDHALALIGDEPVLPLLSITTARRTIEVRAGGNLVAEISLDESEIVAAEQRELFCELEIELRPAGTATDLEAIVAALRGYTQLVPEHRSKLERGLALMGLVPRRDAASNTDFKER